MKKPDGLGLRGRQLWDDLTATYGFDAGEEDVLLEACRTLDTIDSLAAAIERDGVMITGSQGQLVLNSAIAEQRQQQAAFARLWVALNVGSAESATAILSATTVRARAAANARWSRSKGVRSA